MSTEPPRRILIVENDAATVAWLRSALAKENLLIDVALNGRDALDHVRVRPPDLILLERALPDMDGVEWITRVRQEPAARDARILIFSVKGKQQDILAALAAGADDYIVKRRGAEIELMAKIKAAARAARPAVQSSTAPVTGRLLSFLSSKGGSGTTTLALNTAYALHEQRPRGSVLLADMVFPIGSAARMLGLLNAGTIAGLSRQAEEELSPEKIQQGISYSDEFKLSVLGSANDLEEAQSADPRRMLPIFQRLRSLFDYTVVDFGKSLSRMTLPVLEASDLILLVVTPDTNSIAVSRIMLDYVTSHGIKRQQVVLVQNRVVLRSWMSKESIEAELKHPVELTIPYDGEQMPLSTNAHVPYLYKYDNMATSLSLRQLAQLALDRLGPG